MANRSVQDWAKFTPTNPDEVLTKIEHLLKITSDTYRETGVVPVARRGRPRKNQTTTMTDDVQEASGRRRKGEEEEDKELLKVSSTEPVEAVTQQPPRLQGEMRPYQIEGLRWMVELFDTGVNGILADEMGLGKTIQTISLLAYLKEIRDIDGKHLIIVPKSTMSNWAREFGKFYPHFKIVSFQGDKEERPPLVKQLPTADIILTTYEICLIEQTVLRKFKYSYVILDEAHRIKNDNAKTTQTIRSFQSEHRLLITGTPINNNLDELWTLLNFLRPDLFHSNDEFRLLFDDQSIADKQPSAASTPQIANEDIDETALELLKDEDEDAAAPVDEVPVTPSSDSNSQSSILSRLHRILRPFLLRRLKSEVAKDLPPKVEVKVFVKLTDLQRTQYKGLITRDLDSLNDKATNAAKPRLLNLVMQLRKCANHPYLFDGVEPEPIQNGPHLIKASGKLIVLDKLLEKLKSQGSRVLIFSQMSRMLDILDDYCCWKGIDFCRIDGDTDHATRESEIDAFNKPNSEKFLFLLSTRAGGVGINLYTADSVVLFDSDWNPQMDLQAMDRAHRIGQTKQVNVFRFVTEGTLEEKIIERALKKLALDALIIQKGRLERQKAKLGPSANEMQAMIRFGADQVFHSGAEATNEDIDIDKLLDHCKMRSEEELRKLQEEVQNFSLSNTDSSFNIRSLEGDSFEMLKNQSAFYIAPPSRTEASKLAQEQNFNTLLQQRMKTVAPIRPYRGLLQDYHLYLNINEIQQLAEIDFNHREQLRYFNAELRHRSFLEKELSYKSKGCELNSVPPSEAQSRRLKVLQSTGFTNWTKKNVEAFFVAAYIYGCTNAEQIAKNVPGKTPEEVKAYHTAFIQRVDFAAGERFKPISVLVPDPDDETAEAVCVTQEYPISLKDAKIYISRARSLAAFVTRQKQFRERLQHKINQSVEIYQTIARTGETPQSPKAPQVFSFLDCFVLKYLAPSAKLEIPSRQVAPFSKEWVGDTLEFASHLPPNVRRQSNQYYQAKALMQYYHGELVGEHASGNAIAIEKSKAKKAAAAKQSGSLPVHDTDDGYLDDAIADQAKASVLAGIHTIQYLPQSLQCVSRSGHQWTPRDDATLLYALRCCDYDLPQLQTAAEDLKSVISNTIPSLISQTYSFDHVIYLIKRLPQNNSSIEWQVLAESDVLDRIHYLASVVEGEFIPSLNLAEVISIDHEASEGSWYAARAAKYIGAGAQMQEDLLAKKAQKPKVSSAKTTTTTQMSHGHDSRDDDDDDDGGDADADADDMVEFEPTKPAPKTGSRAPRQTAAEKEAAKAIKAAEKAAKDAEKQRIKEEKEAARIAKLAEKEQQRFEAAALRVQNREKRKAESQAVNIDDPVTQEDHEVTGREAKQSVEPVEQVQQNEQTPTPQAQTMQDEVVQTSMNDNLDSIEEQPVAAIAQDNAQ